VKHREEEGELRAGEEKKKKKKRKFASKVKK